jgi:hypothetical protein
VSEITSTTDGETPDEQDDREEAIEELNESLPPMSVLIRWAEANPPPQSWYDEGSDLF